MAPLESSELRDLTREFTTFAIFCLSEASLQKTRWCYSSVLILLYSSPVGAKSLNTDNRFVINWQVGAKLIRHVSQFNGFATLNASAKKTRHDVFKRELGATVLILWQLWVWMLFTQCWTVELVGRHAVQCQKYTFQVYFTRGIIKRSRGQNLLCFSA